MLYLTLTLSFAVKVDVFFFTTPQRIVSYLGFGINPDFALTKLESNIWELAIEIESV